MGRKGVSKRKPSQSKSKTSTGSPAGNNASSLIRAAEDKHIKSFDPGNTEVVKKGSEKQSSDWNKSSKKG
jgi:hypothetical protein